MSLTPAKQKPFDHPFEEIQDNVYVSVEKPIYKVTAFDQCSCSKRGYRCENDMCENRCAKCECSSDACPCGQECQNQKLQRRDNADVYVFDAGAAGKGLKTACDLEPNTFIMEYVGEVIDWPEYCTRDEKYKEEGLIHRYFLLLDSDQGTDDENIYIDSQKKANRTRYINHSCDPNCHMEKWNVGKEFRMAVYTKKRIPKDSELTFDYKWESMGSEPQIKCYCGSQNCRGYVDYIRNKRTPKSASSKFLNQEDTNAGMTENEKMLLREQNKSENHLYRFPTSAEKAAGMELVGAKVRMYYDTEKCYFNGEIIDFKRDLVRRNPTHKIRFLYDNEERWFDLINEEKGNWQIDVNHVIRSSKELAQDNGDINSNVVGITLKNFPSCKRRDLKTFLEDAIRPLFVQKVLKTSEVKVQYYISNSDANESEDSDVIPVCLVSHQESFTGQNFEWSTDLKFRFRNKRVQGRELKAYPEGMEEMKKIQAQRDMIQLWPREKKVETKVPRENDEDEEVDETKRQLHFPFRLTWKGKQELKLRESRRDRILQTLKDYLKTLQNDEHMSQKLGWGNVYVTSALTCLRYLALQEMENTSVDTSQAAIASLIVSLKYLGLFRPDMWDTILHQFLETWVGDASAKSEKKKELKKLEKDFAQKIWFDMVDPNALLNEMAQESFSAEISTAHSKMLLSVAKDIIKYTIMEVFWLKDTPNVIVACTLVLAAAMLTEMEERSPFLLNERSFSPTFLYAIRKTSKKVDKTTDLLILCTGVLKTLEKLAKKYKRTDMSFESFRANFKSKYAADKIASQHNVEISNGSRLILVPEIPVPLATRVTIVSKSMGSEQRGYSGLWGNISGTNDKALRELCALRQLHHPRQHKNIWIPQKVAKRELSKSSNTSGTGIVNEDEGDTPVHVKKGEMDGGFENSKAVSSRDSIQYCMYSDKLGENLNTFLKKNKEISLNVLIDIAKQILAALRYCCLKKNILHGELSPRNVYVAKSEGRYHVTLKGFGGSFLYSRKDHITALELQWKKYDSWRRDRKKLEAKRADIEDKKKQKMLKKDILEIYQKSKNVMSMVLKKLASLPKHVLPHMAPELLMGSVVYTESCEAWSIGSLFFFLFSRGKLFASVSNSSTPGDKKSSTQPSIDKTRRDILNTIFGRCSRAKLPKEMRSYPGRMNLSEKQEDGDKHLQRVISWLSKYASEGDDKLLIAQIGKAIYGLLKIAPRERTKLRSILKHELFYSEDDSVNTSSRSSRPSNVAYRGEGMHTNNLNDRNNMGNESRQRGDVYDSKKRRWNEGASASDAPMNGAKRQRW